MQQKRKRKEKRAKIDLTPQKVAQAFLRDYYQQLQDRMIQTIKDKETSPEKRQHQLSYIEQLKSITDDEKLCGSAKYLALIYDYQVRPYLPREKLKKFRDELSLDDNKFELLLFHLKPAPIEQTLIPEENPAMKQLREETEKGLTQFNKRIKELSPLVKRLKNLTETDHYKYFRPIFVTIDRMQFDIDVCREIVKQERAAKKRFLGNYLIDKDREKSPQKHKYWNAVVSNALKIVNPACHTDYCKAGCRKTHQKAITAVAELLKILYPSIWKEDIKTIASRIKQKDYRNLSA